MADNCNTLLLSGRKVLGRHNTLPLLVILVIWIFLGFVAIRGVDYHHQGLVFSEALRVANGEVLYRDIFSQYGPAPTYLQAISIKIFGETITSLVVLSLLLHFASSAMMYLHWRKIYSTYVAVAGVVIWAGTSYFLRMDYPFFPWWGDFVLFFSCVAISTISVLEKGNVKSTNLLTLVLALSLVGIFLTRYHIGVGIVILLGIYYWKQKKARHFFWKALFCAFSSVAMLVFIAIRTRAFHPAIYQTLVWPYNWLNGARPGSPPIDRVIYAITLLGIKPLLVLGSALFLIADIKSRRLHLRTIFSLTVLYLLHRFQLMINTNYWPPAEGLLMFGKFNSEGVLWSLLAIFLVFAIRRLPSDLDLQNLRQKWPIHETIAVVVLLGIYPVPDHAHLWSSVFLIIGPTIAIIGKYFNYTKGFKIAFTILCLWIVMFGVSNAVHKIQSEVFVASSNVFTSGMFESVQSRQVRTPVLEVLASFQEEHPEQKYLNYCADALYDSFGAQTRGPDPYNFLWGPGANGVYLPADSLGEVRRNWILTEKPVVITCGPDKALDDQIMALNYEKFSDTQTEGVDYLGGQLSIRIFRPQIGN